MSKFSLFNHFSGLHELFWNALLTAIFLSENSLIIIFP